MAVAGALACAPAAAQFRIEITGVGATQIPLAVPDFRGESEAGVAIAAIVRADLLRSGIFRTVEAPAGLDERSPPAAAEWRTRGVDALLAGSVTRQPGGRWDVRFRLWDVVKDAELLGQSQIVLGADLRLAAHRIADAVHLQLTGEPGVFATRIAYVVRQNGRFTLHVTDADGEGGQVALASREPVISPAWSPDGRELAYVSFESQKAVVWVQDLVTGSRRMLANFRGSNSAPAWSPDGRNVALTLSREGIAQIFLIPREGGAPTRLTSSRAIDTEPAFTPDGRSLYFVSDRGGAPQIYRMAVAGGAPERVTFEGSYNIGPAVSPDGRLLAYVTRRGNGSFQLTTMDLQSGRVQALTDSQDDDSPSFAPNGRLLVYATKAQGRDVLMTTTLDGRIKTRLLSSGADVREPAWGPFAR
jgi:TolB protein